MDRAFYKAVKFYTKWAVIITVLFGVCVIASADQIDDSLAIRAIIGEASGEGSRGMLAVSYAIRNRGTLKGVYGVNAKHVDKQPAWVWQMAKDAWQLSGKYPKSDPTKGATHWESTDFKEPYWAKSMAKTVLIGKHQFYK